MSDHVRVRGDLVEVRRDPLDALGRGAVLVFAVAPLATASVYLGGALFGLDGGLGTLALVLAAALAGGVPGLVGLGMMLLGRTPKTLAVLDLGERLITRGARTEVLRDVDAVAVQRAGGRWRLVLAGAHPITLLSVHGARGAALSEAAEALADAMDLPVAMPDQALRARGLMPRHGDVLAALCLLPVDGLSHAYALWTLASSRDVRARRAAKQSLALSLLELLALGLMLGCVGVPLSMIGRGSPWASSFALLCPLSLFVLVRSAIRLWAAHRARRGEPFSLPGLSWIR